MAQALDTLEGIAHQIDNRSTPDYNSLCHLLYELRDQLVDLRRNIDAWRIIF